MHCTTSPTTRCTTSTTTRPRTARGRRRSSGATTSSARLPYGHFARADEGDQRVHPWPVEEGQDVVLDGHLRVRRLFRHHDRALPVRLAARAAFRAGGAVPHPVRELPPARQDRRAERVEPLAELRLADPCPDREPIIGIPLDRKSVV